MLFDDSSRRVPDFIREFTEVELHEILVCDHGMHFFLNGMDDGRPYYISFVIVRPVPELFRTRPSAYSNYFRWPGHSIETRSRRAMAAYNGYRDDLRGLLGTAYTEFHHVQFGTGERLTAPQLYVRPPLRIQWRGRTVELRGYVDVYFSAIS